MIQRPTREGTGGWGRNALVGISKEIELKLASGWRQDSACTSPICPGGGGSVPGYRHLSLSSASLAGCIWECSNV